MGHRVASEGVRGLGGHLKNEDGLLHIESIFLKTQDWSTGH